MLAQPWRQKQWGLDMGTGELGKLSFQESLFKKKIKEQETMANVRQLEMEARSAWGCIRLLEGQTNLKPGLNKCTVPYNKWVPAAWEVP